LMIFVRAVRSDSCLYRDHRQSRITLSAVAS